MKALNTFVVAVALEPTMHRKLLSILVLSILVASTLVDCAPSTLTIFSVTEGDVYLSKSGTGNWIQAQVGMSLEPGDSVRTGGNSSAKITFFDGSTVELQAGTEIEIASLNTSRDTGSATIILEQTIGSIIFRVTKIIDPASRYEVETPSAVVAVRGSAVQVTVSEDGTSWACNLEGDIWAVAQGVELQIPEGECCIIRPGQPPELQVTFTDPNLEAAIRETIAKPEGAIYASDLDGLTSLYADQRTISDISGLEHCTSLTGLYLRSNQIRDILPVANLTKLTHLALWGNQISGISPVSNLINLTELALQSNQIGDISPVANLTKLTVLDIGANQISDISPVSNLTSLTVLVLQFSQISDISPLTNLINLTELVLGWNQISNISALVQNEGLGTGDKVDLRYNPLSSDSINTYIPQLEARGVNVDY